MSDRRAVPDTDTPIAWSDRHIVDAIRWLLTDPRSPWCRAPTMTFRALRFTGDVKRAVKMAMRRAEPSLYLRYRTRVSVTNNIKRLVNGEVVPIVRKRNKLGWVIDYEYEQPHDPVPLPLPAYVYGHLVVGRDGVQMMLKPTEIKSRPRSERSRLLNPFGV